MILKKMKAMVEKYYTGDEIKYAIISVPETFNDDQRQATRIAATIAGFDLVTLINDATAAVHAHGLSKEGSQNILTADISASALKVNVLERRQGVIDNIANNTVKNLGG